MRVFAKAIWCNFDSCSLVRSGFAAGWLRRLPRGRIRVSPAEVVQTSAVTLRSHDVSSPVQKVVTLLGSLEMKIIKDGEEEQKAFDAFMEWCSTGETDKQWEIKTSKSNIQDLTATIGKALQRCSLRCCCRLRR